jgi:predicted DNA-binding transcriptional regulator AlpA
VTPKLDLVNSQEVGLMLGWSRTYVNRMAAEGELPEPDGEIGVGEVRQRIWLRETIVKWAQSTGRTLNQV